MCVAYNLMMYLMHLDVDVLLTHGAPWALEEGQASSGSPLGVYGLSRKETRVEGSWRV